MKPTVALAAIAAVAIALPFAPARADDSTLEAQIRAVFATQCAAVKSGDLAAFAKTLSPDYFDVDPDGKKTKRDESLASMKANLANIEISDCHITFVKSDQVDTTATVSVVTSFDGIAQGAGIKAVTREIDTFVKTGDSWLESSSTVAEQTVSVGGKIVQHQGTPPSPAP